MDEPINRYIDHAILRPELTPEEVRAAVELGLHHNVRAVCVQPCHLPAAKPLCQGTATSVCAIVAFPHGTAMSELKYEEARRYASLGAAEIDMVSNYGLARAGLWELWAADIRAVSQVTAVEGIVLKVILETCALTPHQIALATQLAADAKADFVKTSTGFAEKGATEEAVATMIKAASGRIQVKASGGIRDLAAAWKFIRMGCARIGVGYSTTPALCVTQ